ncbi:MAG: tetratricopeptide repeat protein [Sandaracinaceae bacterium]|nr:tetratricopeptide repeat protein [Sandaracinaceae bacterium]
MIARPSLVLLAAAALAVISACGPNARQGSLSGGGGDGSGGGGEGGELTFPDEAEARAAPPASEEVLAAEQLLAEGRPREAEQRLEEIVRATPTDLRAYLDLGLSREMQEDLEGAEEAYRAALRVDAAFSEALNNLGALLRDTERTEEGIAMLREAVRVRPGFASAQLNLGLALEDAGDDEGAERAYRSVIRLSPREPTSRTSLGLLLLRTNRRDQALIELRHAAPLAEGRADLAAIGGGLRRAGDAAMAMRVLQQAVDADEAPAPPGLRSELALAEFAAGQRPQAEEHLRALLRDTPDYAAAHYLLGNMLAAREAWAEAAREYEAYLRAEPHGADASEARGRLAYVRSR